MSLREALRSLWGERAEPEKVPTSGIVCAVADVPSILPSPVGQPPSLPDSGVPPVQRIFVTENFAAVAGPGPSDVPEQIDRSRLTEVLQALRIGWPSKATPKDELAEVGKALWSIDMERLTPEGRALRTEGMALMGVVDQEADAPEQRARLMDLLRQDKNLSGLSPYELLDAHHFPPETIEGAMRDGQLAKAERGLGLTTKFGGAW